MSTLFSISVLFAAIATSLYVVLKANLKKSEGFEKLQSMEGSCCGNASAHEVPLWKSSIYIDAGPDDALERRNAELIDRYESSKNDQPMQQ